MSHVLLTWIGGVDLECFASDDPDELGAIARVFESRRFDELVVLDNYGTDLSAEYLKWLTERVCAPVSVRPVVGLDPTHHARIHDEVVAAVGDIEARHGKGARLTFHLSAGTPAMQAVLMLLGKARYAAELLDCHKETGARTLELPFHIEAQYLPELAHRADRILCDAVAEGPPRYAGFLALNATSEGMQRAVERAERLASHNVPVLILGESGTGKERFARAIHGASPRARGPFLALNCGAIPAELVESELFGHVAGAFTGAQAARTGSFVQASGGTLFLDEIGDLPLAAQVKVLRVLEAREVTPVGASRAVPFDTRVIAATNADLAARIENGTFRADLYHRVAVGTLRLPPLRDRGPDILPLIDELSREVAAQLSGQPGYQQRRLTAAARDALARHHWPGNVRELRNTLIRLWIWSTRTEIGEEDVRAELGGSDQLLPRDLLARPLGDGFDIDALKEELEEVYIRRALERAGGVKAEAARLLGLASAPTLTGRMKRYGLES